MVRRYRKVAMPDVFLMANVYVIACVRTKLEPTAGRQTDNRIRVPLFLFLFGCYLYIL